MDISYYKVANDSFIKADQEIKPVDWNDKVDWIDIRYNNRNEVADFFNELGLYDNLKECIEHPDGYPFSNTFGTTILLNLSVSNATDIYKADYISVILNKNLIITIVPEGIDLFNERNLSTYSEKKYPTVSNFLLYVLLVKILAQGNVNLNIARNRLQGIEQELTNDPEELSSKKIMTCEREMNQLSDIIEDQYIGFQILASVSSASTSPKDMEQTSIAVKGFETLDKAMLRLEKKAESLRIQYMLIQQEKSTRKINVLTIIQAVFVPLTFIAGIYGMNFINMPEIEWPYGYLLVWSVFLGLGAGLLIYFYRKGWFD